MSGTADSGVGPEREAFIAADALVVVHCSEDLLERGLCWRKLLVAPRFDAVDDRHKSCLVQSDQCAD
jgi:hypothetical protein